MATCGAGACLALGLGAGVAAAKSGASGDGPSSSQSSERSAATTQKQTPLRSARAEARKAAAKGNTAAARSKSRSTTSAARATEATEASVKPTASNKTPGPIATAMRNARTRSVARRQPPVTVPSVDVDEYTGTWYEVGSVKQFFSIGLVNTTAQYSLTPDGTVKVVNSGNYFFNKGPKSTINGTASPVDATNAKLNVKFFGPPSAKAPGNYWIVDLDADYQYAIVTDPTGFSGFILSRTPIVTDEQYKALVAQAKASGVRGLITKTRQPGAGR